MMVPFFSPYNGFRNLGRGDEGIRTPVSESNHNTVLTCLVILYTVTRVNLKDRFFQRQTYETFSD
jgi:hypothetical protein